MVNNPPILTKQAINYLLPELTEHKKKKKKKKKQQQKKTTTHDAGNPGSGLEQAQQFAGVKPVNGIPTLI